MGCPRAQTLWRAALLTPTNFQLGEAWLPAARLKSPGSQAYLWETSLSLSLGPLSIYVYPVFSIIKSEVSVRAPRPPCS